MSDLNSVFRDQPVKQSSKLADAWQWLIADLHDALPKKRDKTKRPSVLDAPRGPKEWLRSIIGYFYFDGERVVDVISDGDRFNAKKLKRGGTLHEVTWPCKAVTLFLVALGCMISYDMHMDSLARGKPPETLTTLFMVGPIVAYVIAYQWRFTVRIFEDRVTLMNGYFQTKTYLFKDIVHIAKSKGGGYTLHLANGSSVGIFKYVTGHRALIERLETVARA